MKKVSKLEEFKERLRIEGEKRMAHKAEMENDSGLAGHPKADMLYQIAWNMGHAYGFNEVANYYHELAPLLQED
jgi:hypothetical protein